jgi:Rrf2 family protein
MGNKRAQHALNAVVLVASVPATDTVTTQMLANEMNLSVSYLEGLLKVLKHKRILRAYRGPGGGYQLAKPLSQLSAWDVVAPFAQDAGDAHDAPKRDCDAWLIGLNQTYAKKAQAFLEGCPLSGLVDRGRVMFALPKKATSSNPFNLKPLPKPLLPKAPKSVFDLSAFLLGASV